VFAIPGILSAVQGRKAMRLGRKDGRVPAMIGAGIAVGFVLLNVASYFFGQPAG
jgi:threonine/homoserine/homoserine lactone efflux protein